MAPDGFLDEGLLAAVSRNACMVAVFTSRNGMADDQPVADSTATNTPIDVRPF